ncbi:chemotaxis protein CheA [Sporanaerobacter sp. PP17-6a]|uniref:chemotaxis protein CheA n=1 Tax=Sporanaerobacter sp. PP17-6a TaxID=1891289 RepID=UPI00089FF553|nr:chemotaxis protein CheA [Sporanaerobacter sp. PP17-6a]SCL83020.1 Chemotaxis protein CheA [Sporanaerobacter sp. PP17-6a]
MDLDISQYLNAFVEESKEHIQNMNEILLDLEKDVHNQDILNELFRIAHTLKGMAGTMGFNSMANLTHQMEDVLQGIRSGEIQVSENTMDVLFECADVLDSCISQISETSKEPEDDYSALINKLKKAMNNEKNESNEDNKDNKDYEKPKKEKVEFNEYVNNVLCKASSQNLNSFQIDVRLKSTCMLKSARAFVVFNTLENLGEIIYSNPSAEDIEDEKFDLEFSIVIVTKEEKEKIEGELNGISEIENIQIADLTELEVKTEQVKSKDITAERESVTQKEKKEKNGGTVSKSAKVGKTVRVDIDRLDNLMNLVSELIIIKTRMEGIGETSNKEGMNEAIEYLERITTSLHDAVMKVRMVPIERVFNRFPRMVRDLSKELKKNVSLQMSGDETEVDRTVIDEIGDPLIHLIRNSIDHGIEHPEERKKLGKNETGTVILKAYPDGNNVVVEVEDDGSGINFEKIKKKAVEKDLINGKNADTMSKEEAIELLFKPGFSTSDVISDVSGRGVGLDVVKSKIESIGGSIEVETKEGKGTKFIIRIPLTLAIIQALLVKVKEEMFAIPLSSISEIININKEQIRNIQGQEIILYRGRTIPVIRLNKIIHTEIDEERNEFVSIIVKKGDKQAGLVVDSLFGQQEIVIKPLGKYLSNVKYLAGATILGNGKISLILDVNSLF